MTSWPSLSILLILFLFVWSVSAADKDANIYCDGCKATVKEMMHVIHTRKKSEALDVAIMEALEICLSIDPFRKYEHPPPDMTKACQRLVDNYEEEIEKLLMEGTEDLERRLCFELSEACVDTDKSTSKKTRNNGDL